MSFSSCERLCKDEWVFCWGRKNWDEVKMTRATICFGMWPSPANLTFEGDDLTSSTKFDVLFPYHLFLSNQCNSRLIYSQITFWAGQCHVQPRLEMLFHWHQELNLVQRWLYNLRSHASSPLNSSVHPSTVHWTAWSCQVLLSRKQTGKGWFRFLGLPTSKFLGLQWGWQLILPSQLPVFKGFLVLQAGSRMVS